MEDLDDLINTTRNRFDYESGAKSLIDLDTIPSELYNPETSEQDWQQVQSEKAKTELEISELYNELVRQGKIEPIYIPENHELFIGNIDMDISEVFVKRFFQKYGKMTKCSIKQKGCSRFCFVFFENRYSASNLLFDIKNSNVVLGNRSLVANWNRN